MLVESILNKDEQPKNMDVTKWGNVLLLAVATSIDALAVGFSFAMIQDTHINRNVITIGLTSFLVSYAAYSFVKKISNPKIRQYSEMIGGIILIFIGLKILLG